MIEETHTDQVQEQPGQLQDIAEQDSPVDQVQEQIQQPTAKATPAQESFRELRLKAEQAERERDELRRKLLEVEVERMKQQQAPQAAPVEDEEINLAPDDFAEGKHLSKVGRKIKRLEDELKKYQQQSHESIVEAKLRTQYGDFDKVVCEDNLKQLTKDYPEIAQTLQTSNADLYSKAVSAYSMIKKLGIYSEDVFQGERATAQRNANKPRPSVSLSPQQGESPLHRANAFANGLTDDLKAQLRKEMEEARKGY